MEENGRAPKTGRGRWDSGVNTRARVSGDTNKRRSEGDLGSGV